MNIPPKYETPRLVTYGDIRQFIKAVLNAE